MADEEYNRKLESLQSYIPFLDNMIAQLKDPNKKNREQQLNKMESLHAMITDRKRKLKLETLNKCEDVISKLYVKVNHKPLHSKPEGGTHSTPSSPSPPPNSRDYFDIKTMTPPKPRFEPESLIQKVDVYSSAAESLKKAKSYERSKGGEKIPEHSKPPISLDDLKCLEVDVQEKINESASLKELTDMRNKIATELIFEKIKAINPTDGDKVFDKDMKINSKKHSGSYESDLSSKPSFLTPTVSSKVIVKESSSIFGNILPKFDEKNSDNKKKDERRNFPTKDDRSNRPDDKAKDKYSKDDKKIKGVDPSDKNISKEKLPTTTERINFGKDRTDKNFKKSEIECVENRNQIQNKTEIFKKSEIRLEDPRRARNRPTTGNSSFENKNQTTTNKLIDITLEPQIKVISPLYKRLADKYNPKPRKCPVDADVDKAVAESIEKNMKFLPPKIPVINRQEPPPPPPASLVKCSQLEPQLPNHQQNLGMPIPPMIHNTRSLLPTPRTNTLLSNSPLLHSPRDNFVSPPNPSLLMSPRDNFLAGSNPSVLMSPRDNFLTGSNPTVPMSPRDNFLNSSNPSVPMSPRDNFLNSSNPTVPMSPRDNFLNSSNPTVPMSPRDNFLNSSNPPVPMSPRDNFISEYAREEFSAVGHRRPHFEHQTPIIPSNNRFMNQRYNAPFNNNFNQNHMESAPHLEYQPPNIGSQQSQQYNAIPPLLSLEVPHFQEQKPPYGNVNRDSYLHKDDLRWRLEDTRPSWDRRDYEPRFRGPMTYREHREMRENSRDPRVSRDPRERDLRDNKDVRDPRLNRDKFRDVKGDTKEKNLERDLRENKDLPVKDCRDPRLNRDLERDQSKTKEDFKSNRFESKFDRIYSRTNTNRSRSPPSRSSSATRSETKEKDSFTSPLNSLYNPKEENKQGKGYGVQSFRIPKKRKDEMEQNAEVTKDNDNLAEDSSSNTAASEDNTIDLIAILEAQNKSVGTSLTANEPGLGESEDKEIVEHNHSSLLDETNGTVNTSTSIHTEGISQSTDEIQITKNIAEPNKPLIDLKTKSKADESEAQTSAKADDPPKTSAEQAILAQFFANLLGSNDKKEKKTALYSLISTFSDSFSTKELSKITKIIHANNEDGNTSEEESASKKAEDVCNKEEDACKHVEDISKKEEVLTEEVPSKNDVTELVSEEPENNEDEYEDIIPSISSKRRNLRSRRILSLSPAKQNVEEVTNDAEISMDNEKVANKIETSKVTETTENFTDVDVENEVLVTVGERIKSRKRQAALVEKPKKKSELDKLHEDIQEMFIRDGVLTASGKRMCHLLKDYPSVLTTEEDNTEEVVKIRRKPGPKSKCKQPIDSDLKAMKHVRVIIHKIPDATMEESTSRRLTRSMTLPESDEESSISTGVSIKEGTDLEDNDESSDSEQEIHSSDNQKTKTFKRKRPRSNWAAGIIKTKKKKKQVTDEAQPSAEAEQLAHKDGFLTPQKEYYVDFTTQKKSFRCKLCDFQGRYITTHYKSAHPDSEVMSARLTPSLASEAIADAKINMVKYETYQMVKPSAKISYTCRLCSFNTTIVPTLFYDHITTHTGEYRHVCPNCAISFCSAKTLKVHMMNSHKGEEKHIVRKSYSAVIVFGYLCGECNYVQTNQKNVDEHVNIYHLVKPPIYKINLSSNFDEEIEKLYNLDQVKKGNISENESAEIDVDQAENISTTPTKTSKRKKVRGQLPSLSSEEIRKLNDDSESLNNAENAPPKKKKAKIGPKSKKKRAESNTVTNHDTVSSDKSNDKLATVRRSVDDLDPEKILPFRCKRAAKEKAQEKLKEFMEMDEGLPKKKTNEENKEPTESSKEVDANNPKINEQSTVDAETDNRPSEVDSSESKGEINIISKIEATPELALEHVKKEIDMNVFTCNTDIQEENKKIEQERLEKMEELNKSVGCRTSLNFVDQLCNRLNQNEIMVKEEPKDDFVDNAHQILRNSPISMPVLEKEKKILPVQIKKPILETEPHLTTPTFDVSQKNDTSILNMIEKLKGKLGADDKFNINSTAYHHTEARGPPPLTHVNELTYVRPSCASTKTLEVCGLIKVIKTDTSTMFCCLVPPCVFSTESRDLFQMHCKDHSPVGLRTSTLCETCGVQINSTADANLLENLFVHTIIQHTDFVQYQPIFVKPHTRMLRIRKLSGDALSIVKSDDDKKEDSEIDSFINNEDSDDSHDPTNTTVQENEVVEDNPFPFKISGVMSLAEPQQHPPPLTPIVKPNVQIVVKEAKLTSAEIAKPRKTQKAIAKFIEEVGNLYKCPHYYCLFTTNFRDFLERHLKAHNIEKDAMIPCVYCDLKTPWEHVAIHIDIRHSNCKYSCSYCLYRACSKDYVFLHQDRVHSFQDYSVIALPTPKALKKFAIADVKIDPKTLCNPYKCVPTCNMEFLFENEFREHIQEVHKHTVFITCGHHKCSSRIMPAKLVHHWSVSHGVSVYQCGYCKTNSNNLNLMYHHLSQMHQNLNPEIYVRIVTPKPDSKLFYSTEAFKRMRKIATLPNITEGDKGASLLPNNQSQEGIKVSSNKITHFATTIQPVTTSQTVLISNSTSTTTTAGLYIVTNSPTGENSLLKINQNISGEMPSNKPATVEATESVPSLDPLEGPAITSPEEHSTDFSLQSTTVENIHISESTDLLDDLNDLNKTIENPTTTTSNVIPVEHVNLSETNNQDEPAECDVDPLDLGESISLQNVGYSSEEESDTGKSDKSKKKCSLLGYQLFRCAFCDFSCTNSNDFRKHASKSSQCKSKDNANKPFLCVHCKKTFKSSHILCEHIQCHGILRFSCSLCGNKFPTTGQARAHMKHRHNVSQTIQTPLNPDKMTPSNEEYIIKPKLSITDPPPKESTSLELFSPFSTSEQIYHPDEIDRIPIRSIFSTDLNDDFRCGICTYTTKVRTNMVRHLQFHSQEKLVPDTAPVNPVPCLEKNEKMFDKMVNLASSSHKSGGRMGGVKSEGKDADNIPDFIPSHTRYTCCAQGCNYICPEEGNLRHHLKALHDEQTVFICVHCKTQLSPADADGIIKHLKLHALQLYKCNYCNIVHNLKHKVEKHCSDHHVDVPIKVITVRCMESEPKDTDTDDANQSTPVPIVSHNKLNKPWRCCMCKTKSATQEGIQSHVLEKHDLDSQYKCALCAYKTNDQNTFANHFKEDHSNQDTNIIYVYQKFEEDSKEDKEADAFDTTPLWQRDRPRVRHIRGILFDESSPITSKSPKKSTKTTSINASSFTKASIRNLELSIDAVASGSADILKDDGGDLINQVNKLMQTAQPLVEEETNDIIIIDDEDVTINRVQKTIPASVKTSRRKTIDEPDRKKPEGDEFIDNNSVDGEFAELVLIQSFGDFGQPLNKQLKCPECNKFKSKRISDFIFHLFKEKKVYRFKCGICGDESITYRYMSKHVRDHRDDFDSNNVITLPRNPKLEVWLQMLIRIQCVKIVASLAAPLPVSSNETTKVLCRYCNKWYKTEQERNEHAIFHWNCIPFKCGECNFDAFTRDQILKHLNRAHNSGRISNIIENGPTVASELQFADFLHMKEVDEELKLKLEENSTKASIAEVLVPEVILHDMEDESEQDGTVQGMAFVLDNPIKVPELPDVPDTIFKPGDSVDDLVIVTKTDSNVPHSGDVYCCEYCPYMSNSEMLMLSHISGQHEHMHIKFKVLNKNKGDKKTDEQVACAICNEVGSEIAIRQHHLELHEGETFNTYRYTCCGCQKRFIKISGLKMHFQRIHPGVPPKYIDIYDNVMSLDLSKPTKDKSSESSLYNRSGTPTVPSSSKTTWKHYRCTECLYERDFTGNGLGNIRAHVRNHFRAFACGGCGMSFRTRGDASTHYRKEHPEFVENIIHQAHVEEQFQKTVRTIYNNAVPLEELPKSSSRPSSSRTLTKQTARKSTSSMYLLPLEEYSFYGNLVEEVDLNKIMTSVEINGMCLNMSADKLGNIFDLDPYVYVEKCDSQLSDNDEIIEIDS